MHMPKGQLSAVYNKDYTTTEVKHEIMTTQCNKLNALRKFKQTLWYKRFFSVIQLIYFKSLSFC